MSIAWVLRNGNVTTALIGASKSEQVEDCVGAVKNLDFNAAELLQIDAIASDQGINLWAKSSENI
jgi:L-glyceraldehyde 3-phosphate reductase